jgi:glycosyltransferase involved in cell wall biosynthesis
MYDEYDYYELMLKTMGSPFQRYVTRFVVKLFKKLFLRFVDLITCTHLKDSMHLKQLKTFNPNVLELNNYPTTKWSRKRWPERNDAAVVFVYVGGIFERKGCKIAAEAFLSALSSRPQVQAEFHFFGRYGDETLIDWLKKQPNIFVQTQVAPDKIRDFCEDKYCVGFLIYENNEYYSNVGTNSRKVYEYLAAGIPIIASRIGEIETLVRTNNIGYLVDANVDATTLRELVASILSSPKEIKVKASNAAGLMSRNQMWWEVEWQKVMQTGLFTDRMNLVPPPYTDYIPKENPK